MQSFGWLKRETGQGALEMPVSATLTAEMALPLLPGMQLPLAVAPEQVRFMARQAIFDTNREVFGYELLARQGWENRFTGDSDAATQKMISDGVLYGLEGLTRGKRAFINCTRESLVEGLVSLLPKSTVLEVLESVVPDEQVLAALRDLKEQGYQIALDDFRIVPGMEELVKLADYVKVDFRLSDRSERAEILELVKGSNARLIAEKVETLEEYATAAAEGFDLFQGFFFCRPKMFTVRKPQSTGLNYFRLLGALSQQDINLNEVSELVKSEVTICYQLLRLVNSASFGLREPVRSISNALMQVGEDQFRKLVINAIALETCSKHPDELLIRVLQRARFLELMSPYTGEDAQEQYMFGLLSMMGVLLESSVQEMIQSLPLRAEVKEALEGKKNSVTKALCLLDCYEQGNWSVCLQKASDMAITEAALAQMYKETLRWAEKTAIPNNKEAMASA